MIVFFFFFGCGDISKAKSFDDKKKKVESSEISEIKKDVHSAKKKLDCLTLIMEDREVLDDTLAKECELLINTK